jgi:sugar-specific transcriptional regulator TrmB
MQGESPTKHEAETAALLEELGLSEYEAYVFIYLLRLGSGTAKDVAEMDHVPRTRVYDAVDSLHERGLVDIQYSSPRQFTPVSTETAVRKLERDRAHTIAILSERLADLEPADDPPEQLGVWTVTGRDAIATRVLEFVDEAEDEVVYMTVDALLTDEHLDHLAAAADRGVDIYLAGISETVQERVRERIPSLTIFETLWTWSETGAGSLLVTDRRTALVSVRHDHGTEDALAETAIWGTGEQNSLVVVLRAIFTWRLDDNTLPVTE